MESLVEYALPAMVGVTAVILLFGIYTLFKGGNTAKTWSNKLMRWRIAAQFIAVVLAMTGLYLSGK